MSGWLEFRRRLKRLENLVASSGGSTAKPASGWAAALAGRFNGVPLIVASVTVTPRVTGRFVVTITASLQNDSDSNEAQVDVSVSHGGSVTPADFGPVDYVINDNGSGRQWGTVAFVVDLGKIGSPVIFPVGTPVTINAVFDVLQGQSVQWLDNAIQLTVTEQASLS
jgi:hypothetical protein